MKDPEKSMTLELSSCLEIIRKDQNLIFGYNGRHFSNINHIKMSIIHVQYLETNQQRMFNKNTSINII